MATASERSAMQSRLGQVQKAKLDPVERATQERSVTPGQGPTRRDLIQRLRQLDEADIVKYVEKNALPSDSKLFSDAQLKDLVEALEGTTQTGAGSAKEKAVATSSRYLITVGAKNALVGVVSLPGKKAAPEAPEGHTNTVVTDILQLKTLPRSVQIALFNTGKETKAVKFASADVLAEGAFANLGQAATVMAPAPAKGSTTPKSPKAPAVPKAPKLVNYDAKAKGDIKAVRDGSKVATMIDLLAREKGTTLEELEQKLSATGKPVNARSWLGYDLRTVTGYGVREDEKTHRLYIVYPKGMTAPLAHKTAEKAAPVAKKTTAKKAAPAQAEAEAEAEVTPAPAKAAARKGGAKAAAAAAK